MQAEVTALETQFEALSVPQTPQTPEQSMRQQTAPRSPMAVLWDRGHQLLSELMPVSPINIKTGGCETGTALIQSATGLADQSVTQSTTGLADQSVTHYNSTGFYLSNGIFKYG